EAADQEDGKAQPEAEQDDAQDGFVRDWEQGPLRQTPASAASASSSRSAASSTPREMRTMPGSIPAARSCSSVNPWWDVCTGRLTSVSTPPRLAARAISWRPS